MKWQRVKAEERFTRIEFEAAAVAEHVMHVSQYRCPHCVHVVELNTSDLHKHMVSKHSNLSAEVHEQLISRRALRAAESFLDFACPGCDAPVMMVYAGWANGKDVGFELKEVLEARRRPAT